MQKDKTKFLYLASASQSDVIILSIVQKIISTIKRNTEVILNLCSLSQALCMSMLVNFKSSVMYVYT